MRQIAAWLAAISSVMFVAAAILVPSAIISSTRLSDAEARNAALAGSNTAQDSQNLAQWVSDTNKEIAFFAPTESAPLPYEIFFSILSQKTSDVRITGLTWDSDKDKKGSLSYDYTITGIAANRKALLAFENALNSLNQFTKAAVPVSDFTKDKDINFEIDLAPINQ